MRSRKERNSHEKSSNTSFLEASGKSTIPDNRSSTAIQRKLQDSMSTSDEKDGIILNEY